MGTYASLVEIAADHHGLVRAAVAHEAGVPASTLTRLAKTGRIERVSHGVYRVSAIPSDRLTPYVEAVMWANGLAVISHASALEMLELCDVFPRRINITVPPTYRPRKSGADRYRVHRESLKSAEKTLFSGVPVVTAYKAILQAAQAGEDPEQLRIAVRNASREGLLLRREVARLARRLG